MWVFVTVFGILVLSTLFVRWQRARQLEEIKSRRLSTADWELIREKARVVDRVPKKWRSNLESIIAVLMEEKSYEACGGMTEVTREMRLLISAQAALLLVGRRHDHFPHLRSILVYPNAFRPGRDDDEEAVHLGESWDSGSVILSWQSVVKGGEDEKDGHNVVIHEFAHQLDQAQDLAEGVPELDDAEAYADWSAAFQKSFEQLTERVESGRRTILDSYGATNPAEFFAVATETFFEKAEQLQQAHPEVYRQLRDYYGLDPSSWT